MEDALVHRKRSSRIALRESEKEEARIAAQRQAEEEEKMGRARRLEARRQREEEERLRREQAREQRRKEREARESRRQAELEELVARYETLFSITKPFARPENQSSDRESEAETIDAKPPQATANLRNKPSKAGSSRQRPKTSTNGAAPKAVDWELDCEICRKRGINLVSLGLQVYS